MRRSWENGDRVGRCVNTPRPLAHLIDLTDRQDEMNATRACSVDGCDRPVKGRGWCSTHYQRWRTHGTVGTDPIKAPGSPKPSCAVDECDRNARVRGYCQMHAKRIAKYGDPLIVHIPPVPVPPMGPGHPNWIGDGATYGAVHERLKSHRGKANQHQCAHCGHDAREWAYDHADPDVKLSPQGRPFSTDLGHYMPLCSPCHYRFDKENS